MIPPGSRLGSYEIIAPLGAGGMGEVYRARDSRLGREVALKVLPEEVSKISDRLARFEQEARAASALNHPNIVTIYEIGESGGSPFIAMELIDGRTVREIAADGQLPLRRILSLAAQAADGLARAHAAGIVHRDLKPENLMVTRDGFVKILDFGLSKLVAPVSGGVSAMPTLARPETHPGTVLGTVAYMSPEQASGRDLDFRSDQFSLGSILYELAAGEKVFQRGTAAETMSAIIRDEARPLLEKRPDAPAPFRWIVERCLAKEPEERYAATRDLARDLAVVRDRSSEISGSAAGVEPAARRAARPRLLLTALAAAAILAAGIAAGWLVSKKSSPGRASSPTFQRITFRTGTIANARFGPDGKAVIYGASETLQPPPSLFEKLPGNPESRRFDFPFGDIYAISSSGEMAIRLEEDGTNTLARVPLSGGVPRAVLEGVGYAGADWGPDGKNLAVVREAQGRFRLEYPIGKVLLDSPRQIFSPRFSPDGREIAFFRDDEPGQSVVVVGAGGGEPRVLSGGWVQIYGAPGWTPDGREVWFTALQLGEHAALRAVDRSGRHRLIVRVPGDLELNDVSKEGRALVGHHNQFGTVMGTAPGDAKERDLSWLDESYPMDISRDGRKLLISEEGEGGGAAGAAYLRPTDGSPPVRLGDGSAATLSRDGSWAVVRIGLGRGERPRLVILPTGAGEPRSIPNDTLVDMGWVNWLPDGKRLVLMGIEAGHGPRLYVQDIAGGKPRPISPERIRLRAFGNSVSPDGKFVLGLRPGAAPVIVPIDGGDPRPIPGTGPPDVPLEWSADGRQIYVFRRQQIPAKIFLLDLATGERRPWKEIRPSDPLATGIPKLLITPDGAAYAYRAIHITSELYIIDGLR